MITPPIETERPAPIGRTAEVVIAAVAMAAVLVLMGGYSVVINRTDQADFTSSLYPLLRDSGMSAAALDPAASYQGARTLAAWFGITVLICLALTIIGIALARRSPGRRMTGWWFVAAGLVCLLGSQLLMYPVAFLFFVTAGLFALRKSDAGSSK